MSNVSKLRVKTVVAEHVRWISEEVSHPRSPLAQVGLIYFENRSFLGIKETSTIKSVLGCRSLFIEYAGWKGMISQSTVFDTNYIVCGANGWGGRDSRMSGVAFSAGG